MKSAFARIIGFALALLGSTIMMFLLFYAAYEFSLLHRTSDFSLPAGRTIAVFSPFSEEVVERFSERFPILTTLPVHSGMLALVTADNKQAHPVMVRFVDEAPASTGIGAPDAQLSDDSIYKRIGNTVVEYPEALAAVFDQEVAQPLVGQPAYRSLRSHVAENDPWAWFALSDTYASRTAVDSLLMQQASHTLVRFHDGGYTTYFYRPNIRKQWQANVDMSLPSEFTFTLVHAALHTTWKQLKQHIDTHTFVGFEGLIKQWVLHTFGDGVSFQYDLLPLLNHPSRIVIHEVEADAYGFTLHMDMSSVKQVQEVVDTVHSAFALKRPHARVVRVPVKEFELSFVQQGEPDIAVKELAHNHWNMRISSADDGAELATAWQGSELIIGDNQQLLTSVVSEPSDPMNTHMEVASQFQVGAAMNRTALVRFIEHTAPFLSPVFRSDVLWWPAEDVRWWYLDRGPISSISVLPAVTQHQPPAK